jgi:hypothetical protein
MSGLVDGKGFSQTRTMNVLVVSLLEERNYDDLSDMVQCVLLNAV